MEPAGRVEDDGVQETALGERGGVAADVDWVGAGLAKDRHVDLFGEHLELFHGRGTLQVGGNQERFAIALA